MYHHIIGSQMNLSDRIAIETGICCKKTFKEISRLIERHPSTIAHEVKDNRTFIPGHFFLGKDCRFARTYVQHHLCGDMECENNCCRCMEFNCQKNCEKDISLACHKIDKPPYVCNSCPEKRLCTKNRYIYSAKHADAAVIRRRRESRQGIRIKGSTKKALDSMIAELVKKGQPLTHIYAEHQKEIPVCLRTLYNYIDGGELTVKNIDLRRKTGYRQRKKGYKMPIGFQNMEFRQGRTYADFEQAMKVLGNDDEVVEMDTVKGVREKGKRLLTMMFRKNNVMLLFLMPDGRAESVKRVFDYLEAGLGLDVFRQLFPVILTDNGSEFKKVDDLELTDTFEYRTRLYYCDPMASWQKGCIEKNHEFIRYVIPKKMSLNPYTQEDITLLMNHINSVKRPGLGNKSPYELVNAEDTGFVALMRLLKMHTILPDDVHLMPKLFLKEK